MLHFNCLTIYRKENTGKYCVINSCLAKFHIHIQKFTGSKPVFSLFKVDLVKYVETIQNSANLKAVKTLSLYSLYSRCNFITIFFLLTLASLSVYS